MAKQIIFYVPGQPQGKARPRFTRSGRAYTPKSTTDYECAVIEAYHKIGGVYLADVPVSVSIAAYYEIPKSYSKKRREEILGTHEPPAKKPDADNIAKIICDALNGVAYADDKQVVELHVSKKYTSSDAGILVGIEALR